MYMSENKQKIGVEIGVIDIRDGKVLLSKRKGDLDKGEYCWSGGKMEYMDHSRNVFGEKCVKNQGWR